LWKSSPKLQFQFNETDLAFSLGHPILQIQSPGSGQHDSKGSNANSTAVSQKLKYFFGQHKTIRKEEFNFDLTVLHIWQTYLKSFIAKRYKCQNPTV
jgi:hypothetical protein